VGVGGWIVAVVVVVATASTVLVAVVVTEAVAYDVGVVVDKIVVVDVGTPERNWLQAEVTRAWLLPHWLTMFTVGSVRRFARTLVMTVSVLVVVVSVVLVVVVAETVIVTAGAAA
jgi:hypothetical protein